MLCFAAFVSRFGMRQKKLQNQSDRAKHWRTPNETLKPQPNIIEMYPFSRLASILSSIASGGTDAS
jgi:hypothetical protein